VEPLSAFLRSSIPVKKKRKSYTSHKKAPGMGSNSLISSTLVNFKGRGITGRGETLFQNIGNLPLYWKVPL
jgi:hypothetical protein